MQSHLKNMNHKAYQLLKSKQSQFLLSVILMTTLMLLCRHAFADDDPLAGTDKSLVATLGANGIGRRFMYLAEGVASIAAYIKTKNVMMFGGVVAIAIFLNVLFQVAGVT